MIEGARTRWLGGASGEEISRTEAALGISFPSEYRTFLATHGSGLVDGLELFGLGGSEGKRPHLGWLISRLEQRGFVRPRGIIPFAEVGNGDYVAVLAEPVGDQAAGMVVYWQPVRGEELRIEPAATGFLTWVEAHRRPSSAQVSSP